MGSGGSGVGGTGEMLGTRMMESVVVEVGLVGLEVLLFLGGDERVRGRARFVTMW